jgi:hypothetical protein
MRRQTRTLLTRGDLIVPAKPRPPRVWWRRLLWSLGWSLAIGSPLLWLVGVLAYTGRVEFVTFGVRVKDLPTLLLLAITGPLNIVVLWAVYVLPAQMLWWGIRWAIRAVLTR